MNFQHAGSILHSECVIQSKIYTSLAKSGHFSMCSAVKSSAVKFVFHRAADGRVETEVIGL